MSETRFRLYQGTDLDAVIDSMARQALAVIDDRPTTLVGVLRRGAPLAQRLAERLRVLRPGLDLRRVDLKVKRYGDDLTLLHPETSLEPTAEQAASDYGGQRLIVVDDVLYQGY